MELEKTVECTNYGWRAVVYDEENELIGYWYGSREDCNAVNPREVNLYPTSEVWGETADEFDMMCERRYD